MDISKLSPTELLLLHSAIADELRQRGITRSHNNLTADLAEYFFCKAFGWKQAGNSAPEADATDDLGVRYQVKGRRLTRQNQSRQLSALRKLPDGGFDFLAGVLFGEDYSVIRAAIIPYALVLKNSVYIKHTNSWKFLLSDVTWTWAEVKDVTERLRRVRL